MTFQQTLFIFIAAFFMLLCALACWYAAFRVNYYHKRLIRKQEILLGDWFKTVLLENEIKKLREANDALEKRNETHKTLLQLMLEEDIQIISANKLLRKDKNERVYLIAPVRDAKGRIFGGTLADVIEEALRK